MTMTIGRASLETSPRNITQRGESMSFSIDIRPATLAEAKAIRHQLLGLAVGEVIPITWDGDDDFTGFYQVAGVSVSPTTAYQQNRLMRAALTVTRVPGGFRTASVEVSHLFGERDDTHENVVGLGRVNVPANVGATETLADDYTTATGDVEGGWTSMTSPALLSYDISPADFYNGSALIELQDAGGSTWRDVVGRQLVNDDETKVRIGNGLVRTYWANTTEFVVDAYDGTAWVEAGRFEFTNTAGGPPLSDILRPLYGPRVLRNTPETCTIVYSLVKSAASPHGRVQLFLTVNRGQVWIEMALRDWDSANQWQIFAATTTAATANTGYIIQTTATGDDTKWLLGSPGNWTAETTNGGIEATISAGYSDTIDAFIGVEINSGATGTNYLAASSIAQYYWSGGSYRQRVVT